jgi:spore coat polysaccharide biosynthesis protein SpsF
MVTILGQDLTSAPHTKIVATIEARMGSSRLPGKVLLPAGGKPMLQHLVERLRAVPAVNDIVLATTINLLDDELERFAARLGLACFRGSEDDVLSRVLGAAQSVGADVIVEITGDEPIVDPLIVEQAIRLFLWNDCDYCSNVNVLSYPVGMDVQVFRLETLRRSAAMTNDPADREHVSLHMRTHPEIFRQLHLVAPPDLTWPELELTLDEHEDYLLLKNVIEHFGPDKPLFSCRDVVQLLRDKPSWAELNRHINRQFFHTAVIQQDPALSCGDQRPCPSH